MILMLHKLESRRAEPVPAWGVHLWYLEVNLATSFKVLIFDCDPKSALVFPSLIPQVYHIKAGTLKGGSQLLFC